jgi:twitching motility protein PilT
MPYIDQFFQVLIDSGASDLHLAEGQSPKIRRHGDLPNRPGLSLSAPCDASKCAAE